MLRRQPKRKQLWLADGSCVRLRSEYRDHVRSYDFIHERTHDGHPLRLLTVIDEYGRECLAIEVGRKLPCHDVLRVAEVLTRLGVPHGLLGVVQVDSGPEFTSKALDQWAYENGVRLDFIRHGQLIENAFIAGFNARLRKECFDVHWFKTLEEAPLRIEQWRRDYSEDRPHSYLGNLMALEYAREHEPEGTSETGVVLTLGLVWRSGAGQSGRSLTLKLDQFQGVRSFSYLALQV